MMAEISMGKKSEKQRQILARKFRSDKQIRVTLHIVYYHIPAVKYSRKKQRELTFRGKQSGM